MYIIIFGGTTEGRVISEKLTCRKIHHEVCVATKSGEEVMEASDFAKVNTGRMDSGMMKDYINSCMKEDSLLVVDATHPYATEVTKNIKSVCDEIKVEYIRIKRNSFSDESPEDKENDFAGDYYDSIEACVDALADTKGNILLTTGSKELCKIGGNSELIKRIYARVLPNPESYELCKSAGIDEKRIIALYGPHSEDINRALIKQYDIKHVVTKESGAAGGYKEKISAALKEGCSIHIIKKPCESKGLSVDDFFKMIDDSKMNPVSDGKCREICAVTGKEKKYADEVVNTNAESVSIDLIGTGMDGDMYITYAGRKAIESADYIFGAARMIEAYKRTHNTEAIYTADKIIPFLENVISRNKHIRAAVLFSGDTGIYSGATKLYKELTNWGKCGKITIIPGISSFSAFAALLGRQYTDAGLLSLHGKSNDTEVISRISKRIVAGEEMYILLSGKKDFEILSNIVPSEKSIDIGYNIASLNQRIMHAKGHELKSLVSDIDDGLFIVRIDGRQEGEAYE